MALLPVAVFCINLLYYDVPAVTKPLFTSARTFLHEAQLTKPLDIFVLLSPANIPRFRMGDTVNEYFQLTKKARILSNRHTWQA